MRWDVCERGRELRGVCVEGKGKSESKSKGRRKRMRGELG